MSQDHREQAPSSQDHREQDYFSEWEMKLGKMYESALRELERLRAENLSLRVDLRMTTASSDYWQAQYHKLLESLRDVAVEEGLL